MVYLKCSPSPSMKPARWLNKGSINIAQKNALSFSAENAHSTPLVSVRDVFLAYIYFTSLISFSIEAG